MTGATIPRDSQQVGLFAGFLRRFATGCPSRDAPAENTFRSFDELGGAERPAGLLRRSERSERAVVVSIRNEPRKIAHAVQHGLDGDKTVILAFQMSAHAGPFPVLRAGRKPGPNRIERNIADRAIRWPSPIATEANRPSKR